RFGLERTLPPWQFLAKTPARWIVLRRLFDQRAALPKRSAKLVTCYVFTWGWLGRSLAARGLVARGLVARGLVARGLLARGLLARSLLACSLLAHPRWRVFQLGPDRVLVVRRGHDRRLVL